MKKIILLAVCFGLLFTACKKSDSGPSTQELLIGKWKISSQTVKEYENNVLKSNQTESITFNFFITFNEDKTLKQEIQDGSNTQTINGTYTLTGKNLVLLVSGNDPVNLTVTAITKTTSTLTTEDISTDQGITYKTIITTNCVKVE